MVPPLRAADVLGPLTDRGHRVLLAPHSQGSIIGATAILGMDEARAHRVALLTHGCPWSRYYAEFHPALFSPRCLGRLVERLQLDAPGTAIRWRNLYRTSDPIGGPILATPPGIPPGHQAALAQVDTAIEDECERVHSSYDLEAAYGQAVVEMRASLRPTLR